jgi:alpha-D-ribose 1-methylphosphonate 5-triphosphate synthase subunit PhnG
LLVILLLLQQQQNNLVLGVVKTKAEAQAIVDAEVQAAQAAWEALPAEEQAMRSRPADIILVE